ncbi:MAG: hypothetical protein D4R64_18650 [Porphyromonadaceae bacterium]|nr:MAG: hypothetical protein D4R64_18650 [Porphyromonadaceae bacterium]
MKESVVEQVVAKLTPAQALAEAKKTLATKKAEAAEALKVLKAARLEEKAAKELAKSLQPINSTFTRLEATGIIFRQNPTATVEELTTLSDALYCERTNKTPNGKEAKGDVLRAVNFLKGYLEV